MYHFILILFFFVGGSLQEGCLVNNTALEFPDNIKAPLLVTSDSFEFIYPPLTNSPDDGSFEIPQDEVVVFACPGGTLNINRKPLEEDTQYVTCSANSTFVLKDGTPFDYLDIQCDKDDEYLATARESQDPCGENGTTVEIGYPIDGHFIVQTVVCFDRNLGVAQQSKTVVTPYSQYQTGIIFNAPFQDDNFFDPGIDITKIYSEEMEQIRINSLLGLPDNSTKYIDYAGLSFLYFGSFTDQSDFMYVSQQIAAQNFIDVAPIWLSFTTGNWASIFEDIRQYTISYGQNLTVISGTSGVLTFPHEETGEEVEIYLYNDYIKVPELFWKVIYDPPTQRAVTVVMHNNPYLDLESVVNICEDISADVPWLEISSPGDATSGYLYICTYDDLKAVVPEVPDLDVVGVLR